MSREEVRTKPKKKYVKSAAKAFLIAADEVTSFVTRLAAPGTKNDVAWLHEYAVIRLYRIFEGLILKALVGAVNNDTTTISGTKGIKFPKHLTDEVCEYLVIGDRYFDFKGRDGLIETLKSFVPDSHYLVVTVKKPVYKDALNHLCALRNYAAHDSKKSKAAALKWTGQKNLGSAGSWLRTIGPSGSRLGSLVAALKSLAGDIEKAAPF